MPIRPNRTISSGQRHGYGQVKFDNGRWGDRKELDKFLQAYAAEKVKIESRRKGHAVTESQLADGSIKLTIQVGGFA